MPFYMSYTLERSQEGHFLLTPTSKEGNLFTCAGGATLEEALVQLRRLCLSFLVSYAEDGEFPLDQANHGTPSGKAVIFSDEDLFPIVLRYLRKSHGMTPEELSQRLGMNRARLFRPETSIRQLGW